MIGLALAVAAFVVVIVTTFSRRNQTAFERARWLPLEDDTLPRDTGESRADG